MAREYNRKLILENGLEFNGYAFGAKAEKVCNIVFNTGMVGYQEALSDPANTDLAVVMTYPLIGNYGITDEDFETKVPTLGALIVSEYNNLPSNFRCTKTLEEVLEEYNIPAIEGLDTRELTRSIRNNISCRVLITDNMKMTVEEGLKVIKETEIAHDLVEKVSCKKRWFSRTAEHKYNVVAVDCGIKLSIVRQLNKRGCNVIVVPFNTPADEILAMKPDGIIISNGPGAPEDVECVTELVKTLKGKLPMFGIGLGHLLIAKAYGAKLTSLTHAHSGDYPVKNLLSGRIEITAQGHTVAVDKDSLDKASLELTHINVLDNTVEGVRCAKDRIFTVQFNPESAPGPQDSTQLFDEFTELMKESKENA